MPVDFKNNLYQLQQSGAKVANFIKFHKFSHVVWEGLFGNMCSIFFNGVFFRGENGFLDNGLNFSSGHSTKEHCFRLHVIKPIMVVKLSNAGKERKEKLKKGLKGFQK